MMAWTQKKQIISFLPNERILPHGPPLAADSATSEQLGILQRAAAKSPGTVAPISLLRRSTALWLDTFATRHPGEPFDPLEIGM